MLQESCFYLRQGALEGWAAQPLLLCLPPRGVAVDKVRDLHGPCVLQCPRCRAAHAGCPILASLVTDPHDSQPTFRGGRGRPQRGPHALVAQPSPTHRRDLPLSPGSCHSPLLLRRVLVAQGVLSCRQNSGGDPLPEMTKRDDQMPSFLHQPRPSRQKGQRGLASHPQVGSLPWEWPSLGVTQQKAKIH